MSRGAQSLVSVIMATYNCDDTLSQALESIAAQTHTNWELVVCDDASSDKTPHMIEDFARKHPGKVMMLRNDSNRKLSFSLNRCLEHVNGEFVARMDADDVSVPHRLACQVAYLQDHPEVDLVGSAMRRFDASGLRDVLSLPPHPDRFAMRHGVTFAHATIMTHRRVYTALRGYTVSKRTQRGQDYDLWFRFHAHEFTGHNLPEPLYLVREDAAAVRRRTLPVRWRAYRTTLIGFRMLDFPLHWYVAPTVGLVKGFVPLGIVIKYRHYQHRKQLRRPAGADLEH